MAFYKRFIFVVLVAFASMMEYAVGGSPPQYGGVQTSVSGINQSSFSVGYDQLGLAIGDVLVVSLTTDYSNAGAVIVRDSGHPGGITVYSADGTSSGQPRLRVDVLVYDGTWPSTLNYRFSESDRETWIAYASKWSGVDTGDPVAAAAGQYDVTANPTSPALTAPEDDLTAVAIYGAREDDFDSSGAPAGYTPVGIGASNIGSTGSSSGMAHQTGIASGTVSAAIWTQAAATQAHAVHLLLRGANDAFTGAAATTDREPIVRLSVDSIDFGNQDVGGISDSIPVRVTNIGEAPLVISDIALSSGFIETNNCNNYLEAGARCAIRVRFVPITSGKISGTLTMTSNDIIGTHIVTLEGIGGNATESSFSSVVNPNAPEIRFYHDFENEVPHAYEWQDLVDHWSTRAGVRGTAAVVKDPSNSGRGNVLSYLHKAGKVGGGALWRTYIGPHEELYFAYDIMFNEGFEWVRGGKLPGLMGGPNNYGGGNVPDGTDGWMGRLMWRWGGRMSTYMNTHAYYRSPRGAKDIKWEEGIGDILKPGQWHRLEMRYKMNTPGKTDGIHQAWLDGKLVADLNLSYRTLDSVKVDELIFNTFYGGSSEDWAPINDHYIYFDNFVVSTQPITH